MPHTVCGMDSVLGGGVLLAVAAALWLVYLVPNWLRRSEYLATERNAVRLQQTIRVLAETAETPETVRLENAAKARALEAQLRNRPVAVGTPATLEDTLDPRVRAAVRLRRTRIATSIVVGIAGVILLSQLVGVFVGGLATASPLLVAFAAGVLLAGLALQRRLARAARARRASTPAVSERSSRLAPLADHAIGGESRDAAPARDWTPAPIPQPLYQLRREAALRSARAAEARAAREAASSPPAEERPQDASRNRSPAAAPRPAAERAVVEQAAAARSRSEDLPKAPSRFAAMGVLGDVDSTVPDIDGALARRRAG